MELADNLQRLSVFAILAVTMVAFVWGRWRYDLVAVLALLTGVFVGVVPAERSFMGFGHPAVITVAAVLVISRALQVSGLVDRLVRLLAPTRRSVTMQIGAASTLGAVLSAFMNNVGALALMLPVTLRNSYKAGRPPSQVLMPLSFATLLGGLVTMIGTPPNVVIATFRTEVAGEPFGMFDFTPVGLSVAAVGILFITVIGWRLIPHHAAASKDDQALFHIEAYVTETKVPADSEFIGKQVRAIEQLCENEVTVMAILRGERRLLAPAGVERLGQGDILILEGDPAALQPLIGETKLVALGGQDVQPEQLRSEDIRVIEAVVMPNAPIEGRSMRGLRMHDRYGINLLAVARKGEPPMTRLGRIRFRTGDVLLLQGDRAAMQRVLTDLGCLPLAERGLQVARRRRAVLPLAIFGAAIAASALGLVPVQIAFVTAVVALIVTKAITIQDVYDSIEWPIILLLGALIPLGEALKSTGGTDLIADSIISMAAGAPIWFMLTIVLVASMWLSDLIHNTPTAVLMAPIGVAVAQGLNAPVDPFLMAVAVGSASPYLTPIGHQSNTLVMGPGNYRFGDYLRMGAPLEILIVCVAVPMIMWVWLT